MGYVLNVFMYCFFYFEAKHGTQSRVWQVLLTLSSTPDTVGKVSLETETRRSGIQDYP